MPVATDLIEPALLHRPPPRPLPFMLVPNLLGEYVLERPFSAYFDPLLVGGIIAAVAMALLGVGLWLWVILLTIMVIRLLVVAWDVAWRVYEDVQLLKYGEVLWAHVLRMRSCRDYDGEIAGAYLDCAIRVGPRRTSVGSVWMPDIVQAMALERRGRLLVLCLPRTPGTWRLLEYTSPDLCYEPAQEG